MAAKIDWYSFSWSPNVMDTPAKDAVLAARASAAPAVAPAVAVALRASPDTSPAAQARRRPREAM